MRRSGSAAERGATWARTALVFSPPVSELDVRVVVAAAAPAEDVIEAIRRGLREFNRAANPAFYAQRDLPENAPRPLHVVAYDAAGAVVGGLIGTTCLAWLEIDVMSVRAAERRRGIGSRLVRAAEAEAVARGCRHSAVDTMDFQAPGFYGRLGYAVAGRFEDRDGHGHTKYFLTRRLAGAEPPSRAAAIGREGRTPAFSVFRAGVEHFDVAARAVRDVHERPTTDEGALAAFLADRSCILLVAVADEDVVGSVNGYALRHPQRPEPQFLLYELDVKPAWRRRGVGTSLVTAFADAARAQGAFEVWVGTNESNAAAMATYRRCGFERRNRDDAMLSLAL